MNLLAQGTEYEGYLTLPEEWEAHAPDGLTCTSGNPTLLCFLIINLVRLEGLKYLPFSIID